MITTYQSTKGILWGVIASFFLSFTFLINSLIAESGGHWAWTANLRTLFLIPILIFVLFLTGHLKPLIQALKTEFLLFMKWGLIGFGVLYTFIAIASLFTPGWMVAATFQINIIAGILLAPLIYKDERKQIPKKAILYSIFILIGVFIMQVENKINLDSVATSIISFILILIGAIVWPLGNRKLLVSLEVKKIKLNATQRVLGMSIGCFPLLILLSIIGYSQSGLPTVSQCEASFYSALFSGFLGGAAFYNATQIVHASPLAIAAIEATQALEIIFTLIGEIILIDAPFLGLYGQIGMYIILIGLTMHIYNTIKNSAPKYCLLSSTRN